MKFNDLTGKTFGKLFVLKRVKNDISNNRQWLCKCGCGVEKIIGGRHLTSGRQVSCGCYRKENKTNLKHGMCNTRIYKIWNDMKYRCNHHPDYVERNIKVCNKWSNSFQYFYDWAINNGYSDDLTIDRINNDGNYEPFNCRWANAKVQANNRRTTRRIYYNGKTLSIKGHCEKYNLNRNTVSTRLSRGWNIEEAFQKKKKNFRQKFQKL